MKQSKKLYQILDQKDILSMEHQADPDITSIIFDSRKVEPGSVFVAVKGSQTDGHRYIEQAVSAGASAIVYDNAAYKAGHPIPTVRVENSALTLGKMASAFYDHPSTKLKLTGVTGTNGKSTTVTLLHKLFTLGGHTSGSFTTICNYVGEKPVDATHTTPDPVQLNRLMKEMVDAGCHYAFMEVSSHATVQHRVSGLTFAGGIFTNITHDHLDYHKTFDEYIRAKKIFFDQLPDGSFALINSDDRNGSIMVQNTKASVYDFGIRSLAGFKARIIESHIDGMLLEIDKSQVWSKLIGEFNAYNLLAVYACAILLGLEKEKILQWISMLETVRGRFQHIRSDEGVTAIVDYAHTPDALENVLKTIQLVRSANSKVITVVGAGGDRDKTKRPKMGSIAVRLSDMAMITSDNPRNEDPEQIILDIKAGLDINQQKKSVAITDRKEAIRTACMLAKPGDIILIAGKGHEEYQEIKGVKHHFSDAEIVHEIFGMKNKQA